MGLMEIIKHEEGFSLKIAKKSAFLGEDIRNLIESRKHWAMNLWLFEGETLIINSPNLLLLEEIQPFIADLMTK